MISGEIAGQYTTDKELLAARGAFQAGLTLSEAYRFISKRGFTDKAKLIDEWRKMKKLFGHGSARLDYVNGWRYAPKPAPTQAQLDTFVSPLCGSYGNWKGITGPGKLLREILKQ